jgi:hypothetical protein
MSTRKVTLNCAHIKEWDLAVVDDLARMQLEARRCGCKVRLEDMSSELLELICFAGLDGALCVEVQGQPEEWEQPGGVEEKRELDDPAL